MKNLLNNIKGAIQSNLIIISLLVLAVIITLFIVFGSRSEDGSFTFDGKDANISEQQKQALCAIQKQAEAEAQALSGVNVPQDSGSGCEPRDLAQMGALVYYAVPMATPTEFYNSVNGKGFNEGYGYQCVAAFKEFQYSLSGKYVATSNGGASGYAKQQSQIEPLGFKWHDGTAGIQDGDWAIWTTGQYGHVAMKYGDKWFSQNQYASDPNKGNPFNLASISADGIAGYYRPNIYQNLTPTPPDGGNSGSGGDVSDAYTVQSGDTLGGISINQGWWVGTKGLYGDSGYAQRLADFNDIQNRGLIYPNQVIKKAK